MATEDKSKIIISAESALKSIKDWRERKSEPVTEDIGQAMLSLSRLPPLNQGLVKQMVDAAIDSDGDIPLTLHAIGCLNFIGGGEHARIAKITGKSKRWKKFSQEELPSVLDLISEKGVRAIVGFCVSDLGDFIDNTQQDKDNIEQNVAAMRRDLDQMQKTLKRKWGKNSPEIRVFRHQDVFETGPVGKAFDKMFVSEQIDHDDIASLRAWLLENAASPETDPFLIHAPEDEAVFQIFASGILYAADIATSAAVIQEQFPAEEIRKTVMLNLFPDYKADAVIQRVFTEMLVPKDQQSAVVSPFVNAGRWESDPIPVRLPKIEVNQKPDDINLNPKRVFEAIMSVPDSVLSSDDIIGSKLDLAQHGVSTLFDKDTANKFRAEFEALGQARNGVVNTNELPLFQVTEGESLAAVIARMRNISNSQAKKLIISKGVKINGQTIVANDMEAAANLSIPTDVKVISIGKRQAWMITQLESNPESKK